MISFFNEKIYFKSFSQSLMTNLKYRPEIDGLRAIAVLAVLIFHTFPNYLPGGYVGVDIFFVISGYLISGILISELESHSFSLLNFYKRRVRRIFPALLLVFLFCTLLGWIILTPAEYELFGTHMIAGGAFVPNILFWREAGYFDKEAITKPLLHLWSLGVEEQFYLVWPLLLWFSWRAFKAQSTYIFFLALILLITSLSWSAYQIHHNPVADFYSPLSRFWELALGGLISLRRSHGNHLSWSGTPVFGFVLIGFSLFALDSNTPFPGLYALIPCIGAALIIFPSRPKNLIYQFLSLPPMIWLGLISYPLYLWHWPLLSFGRILEGQSISPSYRLSLILVAIFLSIISYHLVEKPIRRSRRNSMVVALLVCMAVAISFGVVLRKKDGFKHRHAQALSADPSTMIVGEFRNEILRPCQLDQDIPKELDCFADKRDPITYAILGDSKAEALFYGLTTVSSDDGHWLLIDGIHPAPRYSTSQDPTNLRIQKVFSAVEKTPWIKVVVIANTITSIYPVDPKNGLIISGAQPAAEQFDIWNDQISALEKSGKKVVLVIDNPIFPDPTSCLSGGLTNSQFLNQVLTRKANPSCQIPLDQFLNGTQAYRDWLYHFQNQHPKLVVFDSIPYLCDTARNICQISEGQQFLYSYGPHISDFSAKKMGQALTKIVDNLAKDSK